MLPTEALALDDEEKVEELLADALLRRGPDSLQRRKTGTSFCGADHAVELFGSVLHLRGSEMCVQPVKLDNGSYFVYNGEIWGLNKQK